jgi:hypothetical protein
VVAIQGPAPNYTYLYGPKVLETENAGSTTYAGTGHVSTTITGADPNFCDVAAGVAGYVTATTLYIPTISSVDTTGTVLYANSIFVGQ